MKGVASTAEIARGAGKNQIVKIIRATARVRNDVVVLCPHGLKRGMLLHFLVAPDDGLGIGFVNELSRLAANDWHAAEPAVIAVALMNP
ncbi:MAG: hypothetical protein ABS92_00120 [Thiobacillus sp. SCN 63-374]|nr:MAG: hypothetical protein ABS92_00120 [Thiobacillus sp. SCN 63-374]